MAATYLSLVNQVLTRLREDTVTTVNASQYSQLIGQFINETKREVENSWNWTSLRTLIPVVTIAGQDTYTLTGLGQRGRILDAIMVGFGYCLPMASNQFMNQLRDIPNVQKSTPFYYSVVGYNGNDPQVKFYPQPDKAYTINFDVVAPKPDMVVDTDTCTMPDILIVMGAWARAISERGEDGGNGTAEQSQMYAKMLGDYISLDAALNPLETEWHTV